MAFEHTRLPVFGVQFHPEAILTNCGYELLANFLRRAGLTVDTAPREVAPCESSQAIGKARDTSSALTAICTSGGTTIPKENGC